MARLVGTPFEGCASLTLIGFGVNDPALTSTQVRSAELAFTTVGKEAGFGDVGISR